MVKLNRKTAFEEEEEDPMTGVANLVDAMLVIAVGLLVFLVISWNMQAIVFNDDVTPEQFINEIRKPIRRNPLITRTLYYSKDMESFATGLKRISEACGNAGVKVEFYGDEYGFTVRFYRHCGEGWGDSQAKGTTQRNVQSDNGTLSGTLNGTLTPSEEQKEHLKALIRQNSRKTIFLRETFRVTMAL